MTAQSHPTGPSSTPTMTALPVATLADILRRAGARHASPEVIQADLDAGAPVNDDGTINLIEYAAWLVREAADRRPQAAGEDRESLMPSSSLQPQVSSLERSDHGD
jgi:hypothetical protein